MRIRRHLFFYNTVSVLVALAAMLAVNGAVTHAIGRYYRQQAEQLVRELPPDRRPEEGALWIERGEGTLELVGTVRQPRPWEEGRRRPQSEALMLSLLLSGGAAIVVILLLNSLFTRYQVKKLLQPVEALTRAAGRVEEGDYTQAIDYQGRDEFASVCAAFNRMQEHLLAEQEKNAAYPSTPHQTCSNGALSSGGAAGADTGPGRSELRRSQGPPARRRDAGRIDWTTGETAYSRRC